MNKSEEKFLEIRRFCEKNADPGIVKKYSRYFTEGYDAYGLDQKTYESQRDKWLELWKEEFSLKDLLHLGDELISTGRYEEASYAISFIYSHKEKLTAGAFGRLGDWLEEGILNWAHTDFLSGKVLSYFFLNDLVGLDSLKEWTESASKWKRRAVPVTLIALLKTGVALEKLFPIIDPLMPDGEKFVQKGLGWFLREAWKIYPGKTESFLLKWKDTCGRTIIQYATEKMDKENKARFKRAKKI